MLVVILIHQHKELIMADISSLVMKLKSSAEKGYTVKFSVRLGKDQIRVLNREGFSVKEEKDPKEKRHGLFKCKVEWTNPTVPGGKAEELLRISQNSPKNRPRV